MSLITPFATHLPAEGLNGSSVLAVVVAGPVRAGADRMEGTHRSLPAPAG